MVEVIAVFGPTASGKSAVAEEVADRLGTGIVSCDALQVYRGLPILTNQPTRPTALVGIKALDEEMSVGEYAALAHAEIDRLVACNGVAVVCGGTGLYLRAALADLAVPRPADTRDRARIEEEVEAHPGSAHRRLAVLDPRAAGVVHENDHRRLVRALELAEAGASLAPADSRLWKGSTRRPSLVVGLELDRGELEHRIVARTEAMFRAGVVAEVTGALRHPVSRTAEKALGLREIATLPEDDARARIVVRTRRYAAYQRKWMRRIPELVLLDGTQTPAALAAEIAAHSIRPPVR